ncbi:hypothetical protein E2320_018899, partial [Naja naja]
MDEDLMIHLLPQWSYGSGSQKERGLLQHFDESSMLTSSLEVGNNIKPNSFLHRPRASARVKNVSFPYYVQGLYITPQCTILLLLFVLSTVEFPYLDPDSAFTDITNLENHRFQYSIHTLISVTLSCLTQNYEGLICEHQNTFHVSRNAKRLSSTASLPDSPFVDMPLQQSLHLVTTAWNNVNQQKRIFYTRKWKTFYLDILPCTEEEGGGNVVFG